MLNSKKAHFISENFNLSYLFNGGSCSSIGWSVALHALILSLVFFGSQYQSLIQVKALLPKGNTLEIVMDSSARAVRSLELSQKKVRPKKPLPQSTDSNIVKKQERSEVVSNPNPIQASENPTAAASTDSVSNGAPVYGVSDGAIVSIRDRYIAELKAFIESKKQYPPSARMLRQSGKVVVSFTLSSAGHIGDVTVVKGCAFEKLNESAKSLLESLQFFKQFPEELKMNQLKLVVPIEYTLS
jgi:protein TonB